MTDRAGATFLRAAGLLSGWLAVMLLAANALSGLWLWLAYDPQAAAAYDSVLAMESARSFGGFIRALHGFSSHFLVAAALVHFFLVLAMLGDHASWLKGKWASGVVAGALAAALAFLGRILPMDMHGGVSLLMLENVAPWGGIAAGLPGGAGASKLGVVLWLHVVGAAALGLALAGHMRTAPAGAGEEGAAGPREGLPARIRIWTGVTAAFVLVGASAFFRAPLGIAYDERLSGIGVSAEWYLRWLQFLAESFPTAFRIVPPGLLVMALATPAACRAAGVRRVQAAWLVMILSLGVMNVLGGK
jgi:hypothetical protein